MIARAKMWMACYCLLCTVLGHTLGAEQASASWSYVKETPEQHAAKMQWWNTAPG